MIRAPRRYTLKVMFRPSVVLFVWSVGSASLFAQSKVDFAREVQPIFERSCAGCHGNAQQMGKLRLDSKASTKRTLTPGHPEESSLYQRVTGTGEGARMPMGGKPLPAADLDVLKRWIAEGATWPEEFSIDSKLP